MKEILRLGFRSQITLPLFEDQTVAGTLTMYAREPNFFDEEELRLLTELAGDISFALANISRQQKLAKLAASARLSSEINAAIVRIHDRQALLRETCRIAVEHGKFELVWIACSIRKADVPARRMGRILAGGVRTRVSWASIDAPRGDAGRGDADPQTGGAQRYRRRTCRRAMLRQEALQAGLSFDGLLAVGG